MGPFYIHYFGSLPLIISPFQVYFSTYSDPYILGLGVSQVHYYIKKHQKENLRNQTFKVSVLLHFLSYYNPLRAILMVFLRCLINCALFGKSHFSAIKCVTSLDYYCLGKQWELHCHLQHAYK